MDRPEADMGYMRQAILEGRRASGKTGSNPPVGVVIVKEGRVIGRGYTSMKGGNHAEINALLDAKISVDSGTLYSTLEPCSHFGATPPCCFAIVSAGIRRVVIGIRDPYYEVNGRGIAYLARAGLDVKVGVCADVIRNDLSRYLDEVVREG